MTLPPPLTAAQVRALARDEALWERGVRLWQRGAVARPTRRGRLLLASVLGSEPQPYTATAEAPAPGQRRWTLHCTCPFFEIHGGPCKHTVALLLAWAEQPDGFQTEPSLDERLAGPERAAWLDLLRDTLRATPALRRLLALEPERRKPLGRALNLAPFDEQLRYAQRRFEADPPSPDHLFSGILETAAGFVRVDDAANAARLASRLAATLLDLPERPRPLARLLLDTLTLLEAAALDAAWSPDEQAGWLAEVMRWWEAAHDAPDARDRLLDLVLHSYRPADVPAVERWLRGLLRLPVQGNRQSNALWRQRVLAFLLAFYGAAGGVDALLDLCWEEGEDALAARTLVARGDAAAVEQLAAQGLGSANAHREVAAALLDVAQPDAARAVAEAGLRYPDAGRGALLAWLAARALAADEAAQALRWAEAAWDAGATRERFRLLRDAATQGGEWEQRAPELRHWLTDHAPAALRVEIATDEGAWDEAAAGLPHTGERRDDLTDALARAAAPHNPPLAIALLFDLADLRAEGRTRAAYAQAALALLAAGSLADATGNEAAFQARLAAFRQRHARQRALLDEVARRA